MFHIFVDREMKSCVGKAVMSVVSFLSDLVK